jgi:hypothetical protein
LIDLGDRMIFSIAEALQSIRPGSQWTLRGDEYSGIEWISEDIDCPTEKEVNDEIARLQDAWNLTEYSRLRAKEYPDFRDYLDGIVKSDQDQIDAYIAACQAVKDKYPKP